MDRLYIKNFGPLKEIDINLNKINLFIGENGSGKSILAKVVTIVLDTVENANKNKNDILQSFKDYNIDFIVEETEIKYISENHKIFSLKKFKIEQSISSKINDVLESNEKIDSKFLEDKKRVENILKEPNKLLEKEIEEFKNLNRRQHILIEQKEKIIFNINAITPKYIPAERNLISLFNKSISSLLIENIPLPKFILSFASEYEKARNEINELEFLNVKYVNANRDKIYYSKEESLDLEHSSSGIQSALPLYLTIKYFSEKYRDIIIEEPEQNLFPKAQSETIRYIIENTENNIYLMTHSPYVLSTLNTLMMAYKAGSLGEEAKKEVSTLIDENQWINPKEFSGYYLENGVAEDIKGKTGLISENKIDEISDDMAYDFDELLDLYSECSDDK